MKIGVPKEVKNNHEVFIQKDAGTEIGFQNEQYEKAGALIIDTAKKLYE